MAFNPKDHMMDLKGKDYLQVMWRLVWFREEHPDWRIETQLIEHKHGEYAAFKATISEPKTEHVLATGYGSESIKDFKDYLEKAETKAIGRALAILGYGTQFAPEFDEGERIVDSPVTRQNAPQQVSNTQTNKNTSNAKKPQETPQNAPQGYSVNKPTAADVAAIAKDVAGKISTETDRDKCIRVFKGLDERTQMNILKGLGLERIEDISKQTDIDRLFNNYIQWGVKV